MKLIEVSTGKAISEIMANHSMTVEEAVECVGGEYHFGEDGFDSEVIIDGEVYDPDDIDIEG